MDIEIGDTSVILSLTVTKNGGLTGLSPRVSLRRVSDGQFLDFGTDTFQVGFIDTPMTEVDATNLKGVYEVVWDSSQEITAPGEYVATYVVTDPSNKLTMSEVFSFDFKHNVEVDDIRKMLYNRMVYDSTASTLTLYDDDKSTVLQVFDTKGDGGGPSGLSPIFERNPQ